MLFNSLPFILGFLPLTLAGYWLLANHPAPRLWWLLAASATLPFLHRSARAEGGATP